MQIINQIKSKFRRKLPEIRAKPEHKKSIGIFLAFLALGCLLQLKELNQDKISKTGALERNDPGAGETIRHLALKIPELAEESDYTVTVAEQILGEEEREELFRQAEREIDETFCGQNPGADLITEPVVLKKTLCNGLVDVEWQFDDYEIMNSNGTIREEAVSETGNVVTATATLTYGGDTRLYEFPFYVYPRTLTDMEAVEKELTAYFEEESKKSGESTILLPEEAGGFRLIWNEQTKKTGFFIMALGAVAAVMLELSTRQKETERKKEREKLLMCDYPEMVNQLSLLLGAGMTVGAAWERIGALYEKQRAEGIVEERPTYEEMLLTGREIRDGVGERTAYERFGERCGLRPYRKLSSLIVQNLRKGSKGMTALMMAEADEAFELRKNLAKKLGEEAGTKLLAPMLMMLGIIVVIIMVPAFLSFQQ